MPANIRHRALAATSTPWIFVGLTVFACLISGCLTACQPTLECGNWTFTGTPNTSASPKDAFPVNSSFVFNPANCGKQCQCTTDAMIQMVRVYDASDQMFMAGYGESTAWADANGWMIDQQPLIGWASGYYGENNDGTFDPDYNIVGSNGTPNTLKDTPDGWGANTYFYAVDVAVCVNAGKDRSCDNHILGYYFWSWIIDSSGVGQKFITAPAWKDLDTEFQSAVASWNKWAPTSGPVGGGMTGQILVPNAVPFPTLSDL
ncbi:hypothetical protein [Terracidiphilus sp.]|uniref:hypothetical protein n=1 Tax=Terracidiphilus sp. TaxID=1964191 RepID=UPI003C27C51D